MKKKFNRIYIMDDQGFSLIELSVFFIVFALMMVLVFPRIKERTSSQLVFVGATQVKQDILMVRNLSIQSQYYSKLVFISGQSTYSIYQQDPDSDQWRLVSQQRLSSDTLFIEQVSFLDQQVVFGLDGQVYEPAQHMAPSQVLDYPMSVTRNIIVSEGDKTRTLEVLPETGFVEILP